MGKQSFDLNSGLIDAIVEPPEGFVSTRSFTESDVTARVRCITRFAECGKPFQPRLSCPVRFVSSWEEAIERCSTEIWSNIELEAQNQLTGWLHLHAHDHYQSWNDIVGRMKRNVIKPVLEWGMEKKSFPPKVLSCAGWDVRCALMENAYLYTGHRNYFFLELLEVYEAGHFPCGWVGSWPQGTLLVY